MSKVWLITGATRGVGAGIAKAALPTGGNVVATDRVTLMMTALILRTISLVAMFSIEAAALGLLLIGIHKPWDTVTHIVVRSDGDATL